MANPDCRTGFSARQSIVPVEQHALGLEKGQGPRPRALGDDGRARSGKLCAGAAPPEAVVGRREP